MRTLYRIAAPTILFASSLVPLMASAQAGSVNPRLIQYYGDTIIWAINFVVAPVLMAIAFIFFLWGVFKYFILGAESDTERATGRQFILWGIIAFVIITSLWGLVAVVGNTFGLYAGGRAPPYPTL